MGNEIEAQRSAAAVENLLWENWSDSDHAAKTKKIILFWVKFDFFRKKRRKRNQKKSFFLVWLIGASARLSKCGLFWFVLLFFRWKFRKKWLVMNNYITRDRNNEASIRFFSRNQFTIFFFSSVSASNL